MYKCQDNEIMWSNRVKHRGNVIDCELSDVADSNSKKGHIIASVNWFASHFSGQVPLDFHLRLFQTYCSSDYGSVLCELNGNSVLPRLLLQGAAPCPLFVTPCPFEKAEVTPCPFD